MRRGYFLSFIIMQTEKQKKDFELIKRMGQDFMRKRNKDILCLSATLKQAWRWFLSLWSEWW